MKSSWYQSSGPMVFLFQPVGTLPASWTCSSEDLDSWLRLLTRLWSSALMLMYSGWSSVFVATLTDFLLSLLEFLLRFVWDFDRFLGCLEVGVVCVVSEVEFWRLVRGC